MAPFRSVADAARAAVILLCHAPDTQIFLSSPARSRGLLGEVQQARLLQHVRQEREQGLIGTQDFAHQHKTQ
jgi:hypothetical protein